MKWVAAVRALGLLRTWSNLETFSAIKTRMRNQITAVGDWRFRNGRQAVIDSPSERRAPEFFVRVHSLLSEPLGALEQPVQGAADQRDAADQDRVGIGLVDFRHVVEVHAVPTGDQGGRGYSELPTRNGCSGLFRMNSSTSAKRKGKGAQSCLR